MTWFTGTDVRRSNLVPRTFFICEKKAKNTVAQKDRLELENKKPEVVYTCLNDRLKMSVFNLAWKFK